MLSLGSSWCDSLQKSGVIYEISIATLGFTSIQAKTINLPVYTVEAAIRMVREYVKEQKRITDKHYLKKIEYHDVYSEYRATYWQVEYHLVAGSLKPKGGQIFVIIFNNGKIEHTFGE